MRGGGPSREGSWTQTAERAHSPDREEDAPGMDGQSRSVVGADTLKIDRTSLNCSMYWGAIAHLWRQASCRSGLLHP